MPILSDTKKRGKCALALMINLEEKAHKIFHKLLSLDWNHWSISRNHLQQFPS